MKYTAAWSAAVAVLACTACGANGGAPAAPSLQTSLAVRDDGAPRNLSGQYAGTIKDSIHGKSKASANFAQSGRALGGTTTAPSASGWQAAVSAWTIEGDTLHGQGVSSASSETCTISETATYSPATHRLAGSYHAVHGCSGDTGSFTLKQQCFYARAGDDIRTDTGGLRPC